MRQYAATLTLTQIQGRILKAANTWLAALIVGLLGAHCSLLFAQRLNIVFASAGIQTEEARGLQCFLKTHPEATKLWNLSQEFHPADLTETLTTLEKLKSEKISALVGYPRPEDAVAAARFADETGSLYFSTAVSAPKSKERHNNQFQVAYSSDLNAAALVRFAKEDLKRQRILLLKNTSSLYSLQLVDSFERGFRKKLGTKFPGPKILAHVYNAEEPQLDVLKNELQHFQPDLVVVSDELKSATILLKYIHEADPMLPYLSGYELSARDVQLKDNKLRWFYTAPWHRNLPSGENRQFIKAYAELYANESPSPEAALTYDSFSVLYQATMVLKESAKRDSSSKLTRQELRKILFNHEWKLNTGILKYEEDNHSPVRDVLILVTDGKRHRFVRGMRTLWPNKR